MKKQLKFLPSWWIPAEKQRFLEAAWKWDSERKRTGQRDRFIVQITTGLLWRRSTILQRCNAIVYSRLCCFGLYSQYRVFFSRQQLMCQHLFSKILFLSLNVMASESKFSVSEFAWSFLRRFAACSFLRIHN